MRFSTLIRKLHKWCAVFAALPLLVILVTGVLLEFKKESAWIQPPTAQGAGGSPEIGFDRILEAACSVPEADIKSWDDVDRIDVRPVKGMLKLRSNNMWEIQIDTRTGEMLQKAYRRSDLIEDIHDGSFFHDLAKHWIFFPAAVLLLITWLTGVYIFLKPHLGRRRR